MSAPHKNAFEQPAARPVLLISIVLLLALALGACAATLTRSPVPRQLVEAATIPNMPLARFWGDTLPADIDELLAERARQVGNRKGAETYLALSGGGGDGAFGAGLLVGWSAAGDRPQFDIVTGVSTGALMAPFAFLGPAYDRKLQEIYTEYETKDLLRQQILAGLIGGAPSVTDDRPFAALIERYVDEAMLRDIAAAHRSGRRLLVGTTNLDAQRSVVWDLGRIADSNHPDAPDLIRNVLRASASIPGIFPPVPITVVAGGEKHQELHVDGGTTRNIFFLPRRVVAATRGKRKNGTRLFVIYNSKLAPDYQAVDPQTLAIASRSLSTLIKSQSNEIIADVHRDSVAGGVGFHLAAIPSEFSGESKEPFDRDYMRSLFKLGRDAAAAGFAWAKSPPLTRID